MPLSALVLQVLTLLSTTTAAEVLLWTDAVALAQQRYCFDGPEVNFQFLNHGTPATLLHTAAHCQLGITNSADVLHFHPSVALVEVQMLMIVLRKAIFV